LGDIYGNGEGLDVCFDAVPKFTPECSGNKASVTYITTLSHHESFFTCLNTFLAFRFAFALGPTVVIISSPCFTEVTWSGFQTSNNHVNVAQWAVQQETMGDINTRPFPLFMLFCSSVYFPRAYEWLLNHVVTSLLSTSTVATSGFPFL